MKADNSTLKIKVCGMRDAENIRQLDSMGPDFTGLIFYAKSPRYVDQEAIKGLNSGTLGKENTLTGVFVNAAIEELTLRSRQVSLGAIQLHGTESPSYCENAKKMTGLKILKAFGVSEDMDWKTLRDYEEIVDYFLFDTKSPSHGGTGRKYDWNLLQKYDLNTPYFLSGGIGPEDIMSVLELASKESRLAGVDLNSRYEISPGLKNIPLLQETITKIRTYHE